MKYFLLFLTAYILLVIPISAQTVVGFIGGANISGQRFDPSEYGNDNSITGLLFGGFINYGLSDMISLQAEPSYIQKGSMDDWGTKFKLDYIDIPVLLKFSFGKGEIKPYVIAGPYIGFLTNAKLIIPNEGDKDIQDKIKSTDFGLNLGAGLSILINENILFFRASYSLGLYDINDQNDPYFVYTIKNKGTQISAGMSFPLVK